MHRFLIYAWNAYLGYRAESMIYKIDDFSVIFPKIEMDF